MISRLDQLLNFHTAALGVRTQRQQILAANVANADVPNYKARDIDFSKALQQAVAAVPAGGALATTATGHLPGNTAPGSVGEPLYRMPYQNSIDGNTVELDIERAQFADNAVHVEANLTFISGQIKTMLSALQG